jgi:tetratricopeptide (TPR) repeat protein
MYYSVKGVSVAHFGQDGTLHPGDEGEQWFRTAEKVLQEGVLIDRTFDRINHKKEIARKIHEESDIPDVGLPPIYTTLGTAYARLGEWSKSAQAFRYAIHLEPIDAGSYIGMATAYSNEGRLEPEAIALLQALIIDGKQTQLWQPLAHVFSLIDQSNAPGLTVTADKKVQLHTEVPEVKSVLCSAYQGLISICTLSRRNAVATQFRQAAVKQWGFSDDLFNDLVPDVNAEAPTPPEPD